MSVCAIILAAGRGERFGGDKLLESLGGKPVWQWSYDRFRAHPAVSSVGVVCSSSNLAVIQPLTRGAAFVVEGGKSRQESVRIAISHVPAGTEIVLIHDAARPGVDDATIQRVIAGVARAGAAAPVIKVADTIRQIEPNRSELIDRESLFGMQTPQGARRDLLLRAHAMAKEERTDDLALLEDIGVKPEFVAGGATNFKITSPLDLLKARGLFGGTERRTGMGYDIHRFSPDSRRGLFLGGIEFPGELGLEGHSDADVLIHAGVDAILGAAALGDIGQHFPNTDPEWKDKPSETFLFHAGGLLNGAGWRLVNLDLTLVGERPKVMPFAMQIRSNLARILGVDVGRVSLKATTNEGLGAIGREEGLAAFAIATIEESPFSS